jgi:hypothetical protein
MKRIFQSASALGFTLAVIGLGLSVAAAAFTQGTRDLPLPKYFGDEHDEAQRALKHAPAAETAPTF